MRAKLRPVFFIVTLFAFSQLNAQIEVIHLTTKGYSATGFGGFLNFAFPVSEGSFITTEAGFGLFKKNDENVVIVPLLLGYRHTLDGSGTGFYVEPTIGYSIGATDIQKYDEFDSPIPEPDGDGWLEQKAKGVTAGFGTGYILTGNTAVNIGLRYRHVFVKDDPALNLYSLRISFPLFGRRE